MSTLVLAYGYKDSYSHRRALALYKPQRNVSILYRKYTNISELIRFSRTVFAHKPKVLCIIDIGLPSLVAGLFAKLFFNSTILLDTADLVHYLVKHESKYPPGIEQLVEGLVYITEALSYRIADTIIVHGMYHQTQLKKQGYSSVYFIPNDVNTSVFSPKRSPLRSRLAQPNDFLLGVTGHAFWDYKLNYGLGSEIIQALPHLPANVKGVIIGDGYGLSELKRQAKRLGVKDRVIFTGKILHKAIVDYLNALDVFVFTNSPAFLNNQIRTTSKFIEALATNTYVIATNTKEVLRVMKSTGSILQYSGLYDKSYPKKLASEVKKLLAKPARLKTATKGRTIAKREYSTQVLIKKLHQILKGFQHR